MPTLLDRLVRLLGIIENTTSDEVQQPVATPVSDIKQGRVRIEPVL